MSLRSRYLASGSFPAMRFALAADEWVTLDQGDGVTFRRIRVPTLYEFRVVPEVPEGIRWPGRHAVRPTPPDTSTTVPAA
ncbi:MAG: hypothetical protein ACK53W_13395 [Gemmatimonadota bacterium]